MVFYKKIKNLGDDILKTKLYDRKLLVMTGSFFMVVGSILSFIALFNGNIVSDNKAITLLIWFGITAIYYLYSYVKMNNIKNITLSIQGSTFEIKSGNIFKCSDLKVINFNEYFDTLADNKIIAKNSLNGKFITDILKNNTKRLDEEIEKQLSDKIIETNSKRKNGKKYKYKLGEIVEYDDYLLTSLTKFTIDNRAILSLKEYLGFLMNFWDNLDKIYADRCVNITLFGSSSLTRFTDAYEISDQDLIEIIIWSFKISKIKFKYPTKITMILSNDMIKKINLRKIKEMYKNGL